MRVLFVRMNHDSSYQYTLPRIEFYPEWIWPMHWNLERKSQLRYTSLDSREGSTCTIMSHTRRRS